MLKIFKYLKPLEWTLAAVSILFVLLQVWLELKIPEFTQKITMLLQSSESQVPEIWKNGIMMILCAFGSFASAVVVGYFAARVAAAFSRRLRGLLFDKVQSFSMQEINRYSTASLITRSTNDVTQVQMLVALSLQLLVKAPITAVWAIIKIAGRGMEWTLATGVAVGVLLLVVTVAIIFVMPVFKRMQKLTDNVNKVTRENLTGIRVVRAYNAEDYQQQKFEGANKELTKANLITANSMAIIWPMMMVTMTSLTLIIYWIGAYLIRGAAENSEKLLYWGNMNAFSQYSMQVVMSFMMLIMLFFMLPRALVSAKRINDILDTAPMIVDGTRTEGLSGVTGEVEFRNVSFKYPDANECVIEDISFVARHGEVVAFIGSTGSGKSTIINLVPRFFDVTSGEVLVDGINIKEYTQNALHNKIGYVPQKAVMFRGTVSTNVAYGENGRGGYTEEEIRRAVKIAQGADFVENMEGGYGATIAQSGTNVSGGQKQRLAIARAICRAPEIYIFDDSFSALDYKTDRILRSVLKKETQGATSLIVAQRIGTIMDADQIIVLDEGKIVGRGTHKQLLKNCEVYRQIATSQLSEDELAI